MIDGVGAVVGGVVVGDGGGELAITGTSGAAAGVVDAEASCAGEDVTLCVHMSAAPTPTSRTAAVAAAGMTQVRRVAVNVGSGLLSRARDGLEVVFRGRPSGAGRVGATGECVRGETCSANAWAKSAQRVYRSAGFLANATPSAGSRAASSGRCQPALAGWH